MFGYYAMREAPCRGKIKLRTRWPVLGPNKDVDGKIWNIEAFGGKSGKGWCCAVLQDELHGYYKDTSAAVYNSVWQTWNPYKWEYNEKQS